MAFIPTRPGKTVARLIKATGAARGDYLVAANYADSQFQAWGADAGVVKAAVQALTLGNMPFAGAAVGEDLMALVRPLTILGRLPKLRRVPFDTRVITQTSGTAAHWVDEVSAVSMSAAAFSQGSVLPVRKVAALSVVTEELARADDAEEIITRDLVNACAKSLDASFVDPANAGVAGIEPASATYGATTIPATNDPAADIAAAIAAYAGDLTMAAWILRPELAAALNLRGAPFDKVSALGGSLVGLPVLTSDGVPGDSSGSPITLLNQDAVSMGGNLDQAEVRTSSETSIVMNDVGGTGASQLVSMYQANSIAILALAYANWEARAGSAVVISGAAYQP